MCSSFCKLSEELFILKIKINTSKLLSLIPVLLEKKRKMKKLKYSLGAKWVSENEIVQALQKYIRHD